MTERWLPIEGWEGIYEVSDLGRVRRIAPQPLGRRQSPPTHGGILRSGDNGGGRLYRMATLQHLSSGRPNTHLLVHRLVVKAFVPGETAEKHYVNHLDGDGLNNRATNLEWCTPGWNCAHGYRVLGRRKLIGAANGRAKLTADQVAEIIERAARGEIHRLIAADYGVSRPTVSYIVRGQTWKPRPAETPARQRFYT